ncbi:S-adenosyl-L-methionine-dependent methyltransferase [Serendipita vermifera]|nr:S-adenosyl-L-methionine-dependent methyltransferase [Serendipita vermifera]
MSTPTEQIHSIVQNHYGAVAAQSTDSDTNQNKSDYYSKVASAFGYSEAEIEELRGANLGLSCGNPVATSHLREGEVVVDLGSGAGMDILLAAQKVGPTGKAIGVDMTLDMIKLATENASKRGLKNAEFIHSKIESLPLASDSVDCVISNCVLNLVPSESKLPTLKEVFRVLKPGGRISISDIVAKKPLPEAIAQDAAAYVGCVAGALDTTTYESYLREAGFKDILLLDSQADLNVYVTAYNAETNSTVSCCSAPKSDSKPAEEKQGNCCGGGGGAGCCTTSQVPEVKTVSNQSQSTGSFSENVKALSAYDLNEFLGSYKIYALKGN